MSEESYEDNEKKLIAFFEKVTYEELLRNMGGGKVAKVDLKTVEEVIKETGLPPGVMNVLIDYTLKLNNMKLTKVYLMKIASHWQRKKVKTVLEAMNLAREEHRKYGEYVRNKGKNVLPVERERIKAIQAAIDTGLDDEKLGKFVRNMFKND